MEQPARQLRTGENLFTWFLLILSAVILFLAYRIKGFAAVDSPGVFPMFAAGVMVVSMLLVLIENRKITPEVPDVLGLKDELHKAYNRLLPRIVVIYTAIIIVYMLLLEPLHFYPATLLYLVISMMFLKGANWQRCIIYSIISLALIYAVFQFAFKVTLP
jgi:putative tricarboxylic transport membrane protein